MPYYWVLINCLVRELHLQASQLILVTMISYYWQFVNYALLSGFALLFLSVNYALLSGFDLLFLSVNCALLSGFNLLSFSLYTLTKGIVFFYFPGKVYF